MITLTTTNWTEVENLTDDKDYYLQAKKAVIQSPQQTKASDYTLEKILFYQAVSAPTDADEGSFTADYKFTKQTGLKLFVRAMKPDTLLSVQEY